MSTRIDRHFRVGAAALILLCAATLPVAAQQEGPAPARFRIFEVGDPVLADLRFVSREAGLSLLSLTPPLTSQELLLAIEPLRPEGLSAAGRAAYGRILDAVRGPAGRFEEGPVAFDIRPTLALDLYAKLGDIADWSYGYGDRRPALDLPIDFFFSDAAYASASLAVAEDPDWIGAPALDGVDFLYTNLPETAERWDLNLPNRGFVSAGGWWWSAQLGRSKLSFGEGFTGNMAVSDNVDYHDYGRLSFFTRDFKYSLVVSQMPLDTADLMDGSFSWPSTSLSETTQRYFYYHRWDLRFFKRFSLSLGEGCMVGDSPLELRFLNPLTMYHGFFSWNDYDSWAGDGYSGELVGSLFSADFEWNILPSLALYGQFVMNEYNTAYERENFSSGTDVRPNGLGWLGGAEWVASAWGKELSFGLEGVYADPYLYELSSPFASYIWMRRTAPLSSANELRYAWIGHPLGRDFALAAARAVLSDGRSSARLLLSYTLAGEHSMDYDYQRTYESANEVAPTGVPERRLEFRCDVSYAVTSRISLAGGLSLRRIDDAGHVSGAVAYGAELMTGASITF